MTRALLIALALAAGCKLDTKYGGTTYQCGVPERCPDGFVCVDGLCQEDPDVGDDGGPGDPIDAAESGPLVGGDVLFLTFDDLNAPLLWDRSGNRHDAHQGGAALKPGRYGGGAELDPNDSMLLADSANLFTGNAITIEAWLNRTQEGVSRGIYGDRALSATVEAEASLEIDTDDHLVFYTNHNCSPGDDRMVTSTGTVAVATWTHVAVTWDGTTARFYLDGEPAGEAELDATPCEIGRQHRIGRRTGDAGDATLTGLIDELKVSSVAKAQTDIQASMAFDSTVLIGDCGDGIVELQECELDALCCTGSCEAPTDGAECADRAGTCEEGTCEIGGGRVDTGVIGRWDFDEGMGSTVGDSSGILPAIDLTIANEATVDWVAGGLDLQSSSTIESGDTSRMRQACAASDEVTLELWITPETATAFGQIAYWSDGNSAINMGVQQIGGAYLSRISSDGSTADGTPAVDSADGDARVALTHLVITRQQGGARRVYVDGRLRSENTIVGDLAWQDRVLSIGNQSSDGDPWVGTFHFMAIYDRALSGAEVAQNFAADPP